MRRMENLLGVIERNPKKAREESSKTAIANTVLHSVGAVRGNV
jgi:hypothetical protein